MVRQLSAPSLAADFTVVALCAEWCGTCRDYRLAFERRAAERCDARHVWIDIEDDAEWLGELEVETFPTLLVLRGDEPRFYGPVLPAIEIVDHTLRALAVADARAVSIPTDHLEALARLIRRVRTT